MSHLTASMARDHVDSMLAAAAVSRRAKDVRLARRAARRGGHGPADVTSFGGAGPHAA
jgi:hypothetical protein